MTSIKVVIKVRPLIQREKDEKLTSHWSVIDGNTLKCDNKQDSMTFDKVFDETRTTRELFDEVALPIVTNALKGMNGTIFAYGQTSSGKTYCMMGTEEDPGVVPLVIQEIFKQIELYPNRKFLICVSYIEIYNEKVYDLLDPDKPEITKVYDNAGGETIVNQKELISPTPEHLTDFFAKGNAVRRVGETGMNDQSSRSHSIFRINIESSDINDDIKDVVQVSTLNLVDLAGSERADQTKATGERLREGGHINKSLLALSKVIRELSDIGENSDKQHIPYRDSKLTRILSASLGGNAQTAIICTVTPASLEETFSTLTFATNAKKIKNRPKVNEMISDKVIMNRLRKEIRELREELDEQKKANKNTDNKRIIDKILQLENSFVHHSFPNQSGKIDRRRTWAPSTLENGTTKIPSLMYKPPPVSTSHLAPPNQFVFRREVNMHDGVSDDFSNEVFLSPSKVDLDRPLSPTKGPRDTDELKNMICTPRPLRTKELSKLIDSPFGFTYDKDARIAELEQEIEELKDFKMAEDYSSFKALQETCDEQELRIVELMTLCDQKDRELDKLHDFETKNFLAQKELKKALQERKDAENMLASTQFEFDSFKIKSKNRETDLVTMLEEARNESQVNELNEKIKGLEERLKTTEAELFTFQANASVLKASVDDSDRVKELEKDIKFFREDREATKIKLADLEKEHATISEQLIDAVQDVENLQQKVKKLEAEINAKNQKIEEVQNEHTKNSEELMENVQEVDRLQKEVKTLESQLTTQKDENKTLADAIVVCNEKISNFQRIQEMLINGNVEEIEEDDEFGKIILKMHQNSSKTESLELEKLQLLEEIDAIRATVVSLSEQLVATESNEQQLKSQVELLSDELVLTKNDLDVQKEKNSEQYSIIDELRCKLEDSEGSSVDNAILARTRSQLAACDATIDDLKQQIEKLTRENLHMAATLKECESLEGEVESLTSQKAEMQATIDDLLTKIPPKIETQDKSVELFGDSMNESAIEKEEAKVQIETLNIEISELKDEIEKNRIKLEESEAKISSQNEKVTEYEAIIAEKTLAIENLTKKLEESPTRDQEHPTSDLENPLIELQLQIASREEKIAKLEERIEELQRASPTRAENVNRKLADDLHKLNADHQELQQTHREIFNEYNKLMEQSEELAESNDKLIAEIDGLKSSHEQMVREKEDLSAKIEAINTENKSKLEKHETESMEKDKKIAELNDKVQSLENTLFDEKRRLETEVAWAKQQYEDLTDEVDIIQVTKDEMKAQLIEKQEKIASLEDELESAKNDLESAKNDLSEKLECISTLESQFNESKSALVEATSKIADLQQQSVTQVPTDNQQLNDLKNDIEKLTNENSKLTEMIQMLEITMKKMCDENEKLGTEKEAKDAENAKLKEEIDNNNSQMLQVDAKITNLESVVLIKNEKIQQLEADHQKIVAECEEAKTRLRRRSVDQRNKTDTLETKIAELMHQLGEKEALKVENEIKIKKLNEELVKVSSERNKLMISSDENDVKYAVLDEKYSQLSEMNDKLSKEVKTFKSMLDASKHEIETLNDKISNQMTENFTNSKLVGELREKCDALMQQLEEKKKLSVSPKQRRSSELESEVVYSLQHKQLIVESNSGTPVRAQRSNQERKTRRQSVYDDNRRISLWEKFQDVESQTEATDVLCACSDLREKLKRTSRDLKIYECKVANFERMANANPLKVDLQQAQIDLEKERRAHEKSKHVIEEAKLRIEELKKLVKPPPQQRSVQSQVGKSLGQMIDQNVFFEVKHEKRDLENKLSEAIQQIRKLEEEKEAAIKEKEDAIKEKEVAIKEKDAAIKEKEAVSKEKEIAEKENISQNSQSTSQGAANSALQKSYDEVARKYDIAKRLCNLRNETIAGLTSRNTQLEDYITKLQNKMTEDVTNVTEQLVNYQLKYEHAKEICDLRKKKLEILRAKYNEPPPRADDKELEEPN